MAFNDFFAVFPLGKSNDFVRTVLSFYSHFQHLKRLCVNFVIYRKFKRLKLNFVGFAEAGGDDVDFALGFVRPVLDCLRERLGFFFFAVNDEHFL